MGEILLDAATRRLVSGAVELEPTGEAFRVLAIDPDAAGVVRRVDSPLVGRGYELQLLESAFERARAERTPQLVTVVGQAGVGKSRLVGELMARVRDDATVLRGRCLSYGDGITFWPVRELVREAVGATEKDPVESVAAELASVARRRVTS